MFRCLAIGGLFIYVGLSGIFTLACQSRAEGAVPVLSNGEARKFATRVLEATVPSGSAPAEFTIRIFVGEDGKVRDVTNPNALPASLFSAAASAAREWWFRPYLRDGKPENFQADITFRGPIVGTVTARDGKPIAGVSIYGSEWKTCCPNQRDFTTTDENGQFRLEHPGAVIHFSSDEFQPQSLVVKTDTSTLHIMMEPSSSSLRLPACGKPGKDVERVGGGKYGLHFDVPLRDAKLVRGKVDVDYVVHVVKPKKGDDHLEFWFGPYAMNSTPDDKQFIESALSGQRNVVASSDVVAPGGGVIGLDSWGRLPDGKMWRRMAVPGQGAVYKNARPESATLFDSVINSLCWIPYPNR